MGNLMQTGRFEMFPLANPNKPPLSPMTEMMTGKFENPGLQDTGRFRIPRDVTPEDLRTPIRQDRCGRVRMRAIREGFMTEKTQEMLALMPQTPGVPRQELLVAADGSGQFAAIAEALRAAPCSAIIRVRPGFYREALVIDRPVEIVADGPPGSVVVESDVAACLLAYAQIAAVTGLAFRCTAGARGVECFGVEVHSRLFLNQCDISSNSLACLAVYGPNADPVVRRCRIHHGEQSGVLVYKAAVGLFEECEFSDNTLCAVEVRDASDPTFRRCRISGGVTVFNRGRGTFEECDIFNSQLSGLQVDSGADPVVRQCSIHHNKSAGVLVAGNGRGAFEECNIFANALSGVEVKGIGNPLVRRCAIREQEQGGLLVSQYGRGTFEECDIAANALSGVEVKEGGDPVVRHCSIHEGQGGGVMASNHGSGTFESCDIFSNTLAGVEITQAADPLLRRCRIHHGRQGGVLVHSEGRGTLDECEIFGDARLGVAVWENGDALIRRSQIYENHDAGVMLFQGGAATVHDCQLWGHTGKNLDVRQGCEMTQRAIVER